jgi:hypothetical protein
MLKLLSLLILSQVFITAHASADPNLIDRSVKKNATISPAQFAAAKKAAISKDSEGVASVNTNGGWAEVKPQPEVKRGAEASWGFAPIRVEGDDKKFAPTKEAVKDEVPAKKVKPKKTLSSGFSGFTPVRTDAVAPAPTKKTTRR